MANIEITYEGNNNYSKICGKAEYLPEYDVLLIAGRELNDGVCSLNATRMKSILINGKKVKG